MALGGITTRLDAFFQGFLPGLGRRFLDCLFMFQMYNFTSFAMVLNEVDKEMESVIPKTDCRLRPDIRAMENGEIGEEPALGAGLLAPFILVSASIIAVLRVSAPFMLKSSNFGFEFENLSSALLKLKLIA